MPALLTGHRWPGGLDGLANALGIGDIEGEDTEILRARQNILARLRIVAMTFQSCSRKYRAI